MNGDTMIFHFCCIPGVLFNARWLRISQERVAHHNVMHAVSYLREDDVSTQCWRLPIVPNGGSTSTLSPIPELITHTSFVRRKSAYSIS
jgi:hypothetical protein